MNKPKKKNHITISIDEEKVFDTVKYSFMIKKKPSQQTRNRGELPQLGKEHL